MIHGFPIPYPDELFYSLLARREAQMGYPSYKGVLREVFGCTGTVVAFEFPSHLGYLMAGLHSSHPCAKLEFLEHLTLLPWYEPFLPCERSQDIREAMLASGGRDCWNRAGITASRVKNPPFLRYCPECLREDRASGRRPYWRRLHQITGIEVCPKHQVLLEDSPVDRLSRGYRYLLPAESQLDTPSCRMESNHIPWIGVARLGQQLLSQRWPILGLLRLREAYLLQLQRVGYINGRSEVKIGALVQDVESFYGRAFLKKLGCRGQHWLVRMLRKSVSIQQPIRHLLLVNFIGVSLDEFFSSRAISEDEPMACPSHSSLKCVNLLCPQRGEKTATFVRQEKSSMLGGMIETYSCRTCGQVQARCTVGYERTWVRDRGHLWHARLTELWSHKELGLGAIAAALHASCDVTRKAALKMNLPLNRPGRKMLSVRSYPHLLVPKAEKRQRKIEKLRLKWSEKKRQYPELGMRGLRRKLPAVYATLYRYDRDWLLAHRPPRKSRPLIVNWDERDRDLCRKLELAALRLPALTPGRLARAAGLKGWISDHLSRLPRARQLLHRLAERLARHDTKSNALVWN